VTTKSCAIPRHPFKVGVTAYVTIPFPVKVSAGIFPVPIAVAPVTPVDVEVHAYVAPTGVEPNINPPLIAPLKIISVVVTLLTTGLGSTVTTKSLVAPEQPFKVEVTVYVTVPSPVKASAGMFPVPLTIAPVTSIEADVQVYVAPAGVDVSINPALVAPLQIISVVVTLLTTGLGSTVIV
jgi:hypothetical protein